MAGTIYKFDSVSQKTFLHGGVWMSGTDGPYYYAIIPLEIGKVYKVTLQNVTNLARFRCAQSDSNVIGEGENSYAGDLDTPADGRYVSFVAEKNYLFCYGGTVNGGEVSVIFDTIPMLVGTKWKMHNDAKWVYAPGFFRIDGAFYEGDSLLTSLSQDNNIFILRGPGFGYGSDLNEANYNIYPSPIVNNYYAYERWRVYVEYGGTGVGFVCRDLTDTLYLEVTGGQDVENSALIAWVYGAGELISGEEEQPTKKFTRLYLGDVAYSSGGKRFRKLQTSIPNVVGRWLL